ncbi:hypothetical protein [Halomarina litorea]|uniref:hypothetical protein n=1 Tax=Halomarina litorea TaxID=2961595 RepID=UPI0020C43CB6|nr:hypothetical protein [Halomarina sp. BCD28]
MSLAPVVLQSEVPASTNAVVVFLISLLVGAFGIHVGARLLVDKDVGYGRAVVAALAGALVWGLVNFFLGGLPVVGPVLALVAWVGVINWSYPGGWGSAAGIGLVAWLAVEVVLYVLHLVGLISITALGVPGA